MSQFTSKLIVEPLGNRKWRLEKSFEYHVGSYPSEEVIIVPSGFITDFASIPRIFWPIIDPVGNYGKAAVIHDYCYATACYDKKRSDEIFLEGMIILNVAEWKRDFLYYGVHIIGWWGWYKHRRREIKNKK